jgi:hypothetical protein
MISRKELKEEERRIKALKRQGWTDYQIKSWLRGWRLVGARK